MPIKLKNNTFVNCGTGISAPESADIEAEGNKAFNTGKMFDIRKDENSPNEDKDILKLSPEFYGIGINLKLLWKKIKSRFN